MRINDDGSGDGQELELAAGEIFLPERRVKALGQGGAEVPQADQAQGLFNSLLVYAGILEAYLVRNGAGDVVELLLYVAEDLAPNGRSQARRLTAEDAD